MTLTLQRDDRIPDVEESRPEPVHLTCLSLRKIGSDNFFSMRAG